LVPHLVLLPVFFFTLRPVEGIGPVGAFAAGLGIDVLTHGPLGVTAASMLAVHFVLRRERNALMTLPVIFRLTGFAVAAGFMLAVSSVSMAVLGPAGWPGPVEIAMAFAGLLTLAMVVELADAGINLGESRSRFGPRVGKKNRRRPKPRRSAGKEPRTASLARSARPRAWRSGVAGPCPGAARWGAGHDI